MQNKSPKKISNQNPKNTRTNTSSLFNKKTKTKIKNEESKLNKETKVSFLTPKNSRIQSSIIKHPQKISLSLSRNYNDYNQILTELTDINKSKILWAIKLRQPISNTSNQINYLKINQKDNLKLNPKKNIRNISSAKPPISKGLVLTSNFIEPKFYMEDLDKYKLKNKGKKRPLSSILNPNFNNIKHLYKNKIGYQSKEFAACLRNYSIKNKNKFEKIKWNNYFSKNNTSDNKLFTKFLTPRTEGGKKIFKRIEKKICKPYSVRYKDVMVGNDNIKQKIMIQKNDYCYSGIGSYLDFGNYKTNYGIKNAVGLNENILKTETNSQCLFELGLRSYPKIKVKS